jgi:hypothetical protein
VKLTESDALKLADAVAAPSQWAELLDAMPRDLLTTSNPKTMKGGEYGHLTTILHLAPAHVSGRNVCPHSSAGCRDACLNTAGRGGQGRMGNAIQVARIRRTRLWQRDRAGFMATLVAELERHARIAKLDGLNPAARLNGTSDLPWERFPVKRGGESFPHIFAAFPEIRFYDYTKWPIRLRRVDGIENYSLTFSLAEDNDAKAADALEAGVNVAVVFNLGNHPRNPRPVPESYAIGGVERPVIDGDKTDLRFLDPDGVIVGLRAKGRAIHDNSGFVRAPTEV